MINNIIKNGLLIFKKAVVIDAILLLLVTLWWYFGEHTLIRYCNVLFVFGGLTIGIGAYFILGAKIGSVDYIYHQSQNARMTPYHERIRQEVEYIGQSYIDAKLFFIAGGIAVGLGELIWIIFAV